MAAEEWRPVTGYEGVYEVSSFGRVWSVPRILSDGRTAGGKILAPAFDSHGYLMVALARDGKTRSRKVHRLVLESFAGACPPGLEGCHGDGDRTNNALSNLRWDTRSANQSDVVRHGNHPQASKTHCPQGHPYDGDNVYVNPNVGGRYCRECRRQARQKSEMRKKGIAEGGQAEVMGSPEVTPGSEVGSPS